jgi:hypothetical protein
LCIPQYFPTGLEVNRPILVLLPRRKLPVDGKTLASMSTAHASISATFGYDFKKLDLLKEALDTTDIYYPEANERLAMLGKSLINLNLLHDWFPSNEPEGISITT